MFNKDYFECGDLASRQEELSFAALHAVVASVGGTVQPTTHKGDAMGVDALCLFQGTFSSNPCANSSLLLHVQLKSERNVKPVIKNDEEYWALSVDVAQLKKYLSWKNKFILVLFVLPPKEEQERWVEVDHELIALRKCLYWTPLVGFPVDESKKTNTVYIPRRSILTSEALTDVLTSIAEQKVLSYVQRI